MPRLFHPPAPSQPICDPARVSAAFAHLQPRILLWTTVGYGVFYFVRKNLSAAMPVMESQLGLSKTRLGLILTLHGLLYGLSKFLNGIVADRANARVFMASALLASAALNVCFGLSSSLVFFGTFWMLNGWFQGMGYPPCARLLSHWFPRRTLATKMAVWNSSHALGGAAIVVLCGYLIAWTDSWRLCFFIPSAIAIAVAVLLFVNLRDTPESVGLPDVEALGGPASTQRTVTQLTNTPPLNPDSAEHFGDFILRRVFSNPYIWLASAANFFVYTIRFAIFDWGPTLLQQSKGIEIRNAVWMVASFEFAGLAGILLTGWLTDRFLRGRAAPVCLVSMLLCGVSIFLFWHAPGSSFWLNTGLLMSAGFFVYGPQALVAVIVVNLATKRAAATAVGLTSIFGYASTILSGWGLGALVQRYDWDHAFACLIGVAAVGALFFAALLSANTTNREPNTMT